MSSTDHDGARMAETQAGCHVKTATYTQRLYDRTGDRITLDEIERIRFWRVSTRRPPCSTRLRSWNQRGTKFTGEKTGVLAEANLRVVSFKRLCSCRRRRRACPDQQGTLRDDLGG